MRSALGVGSNACILAGAQGALGARAFFGHNIADMNFLELETDDFIDIDVLAAGALLPAMQADFDRVTLPERAALSMRRASAQ